MFSQFDGNAAFSGGGFMPSQSLQSTDPGYSSSSKNRDSQVLLPLTVKQIKDASNPNDEKSNIVVDGVDVNNIKLVGMVSDRVERATDVSFSIDDGTGRLVCHRWLNESIDSKEMEQIQDGMYVRVHGALKVFQGKIQLNTFSIRGGFTCTLTLAIARLSAEEKSTTPVMLIEAQNLFSPPLHKNK